MLKSIYYKLTPLNYENDFSFKKKVGVFVAVIYFTFSNNIDIGWSNSKRLDDNWLETHFFIVYKKKERKKHEKQTKGKFEGECVPRAHAWVAKEPTPFPCRDLFTSVLQKKKREKQKKKSFFFYFFTCFKMAHSTCNDSQYEPSEYDPQGNKKRKKNDHFPIHLTNL